jgi:hypothetical protein
LSRDFPCPFTHHNFANQLRDIINEAVYCNQILRGSPEMPSGKLVGTTLKLTTGREVTDGHSHFPTIRTSTEIELLQQSLGSVIGVMWGPHATVVVVVVV